MNSKVKILSKNNIDESVSETTETSTNLQEVSTDAIESTTVVDDIDENGINSDIVIISVLCIGFLLLIVGIIIIKKNKKS